MAQPENNTPLFQRIKQRISGLILRGFVSMVKDAEGTQILQIGVLKDEVLDGVERFQNYGFSSVPLPGAEVLLVSVGGDRGHPVALIVNDPDYRPVGGLPGDTMMYDNRSQTVVLAADGITATSAAGKFVLLGSGSAVKKVAHEDLAALIAAEVAKCSIILPGPPPVTIPLSVVGAFAAGWATTGLAQKVRVE